MGLKRDFYEGSWRFQQVGKLRNDAAIYPLCKLQ